MLSWYSLLAFSAWTWLFLPCTASTISNTWRNFKGPSFFLLASLLLHLAQVLFPFQRNQATYLAHWHTAVVIFQLSQISLCAFRLCWVTPIVISSCATLSYKICLFRFLWLLQFIDIWLIFIACSTMNQISIVGYIWSEGCTVRRLAPQPIALTQKTTQKTMKFLRALSAPVTLPSRWWTLHLSSAPNCAVLSRLRKLTYFHGPIPFAPHFLLPAYLATISRSALHSHPFAMQVRGCISTSGS